MDTPTTLEINRIVTSEMTAQAVGSGSLAVLGTPVLAAMLEEAACKLLQKQLTEDNTSIGTSITLEHLAPTPVGMAVTAKATLTSLEGRTAQFTLEAWDAVGMIGRGTHMRAVVNSQRFLDKTQQKGL